MALPYVKTFADCADFDKTVLAYLPQLYDLPQQIFQSATDWQQLQTLYVSTNPLISAFALSLFLAPIFLIVAEVNKNYSQVDRCWSLLPTVYNAHFVLYAHATGIPTRRLDTLMILSAIWSVSGPINDPLDSLLTFLGSVDIQLLAQRRLQHRLGGLSLERPQRLSWPNALLSVRRRIHFPRPKRMPLSALQLLPALKPPPGPIVRSHNSNLHPTPRRPRHQRALSDGRRRLFPRYRSDDLHRVPRR